MTDTHARRRTISIAPLRLMGPACGRATAALGAWLLVALLSLSAVGCDGSGAADKPDGSSARMETLASRYPAERLPFRAKIKDAVGHRDSGVIVGRRIQYHQKGSLTPYVEWQGALTAIGALDDRVAVVFPPADREGFDIAFAGLDLPWDRVHLTDLPVEQVGDIDATRGPDGALWVATRERRDEQTITLYRWKPGEAVTSEVVPRPLGATRFGFSDTCDDLSFGFNAAGDLDMVFQQVDAKGVSKVVHVHRSAGATAWQTKTVVTSTDKWFQASDPKRFSAVGCRTALAHDEAGKPQVVVLRQDLNRQLLVASSVDAYPVPPLATRGFFLDAQGEWRLAREVRLPDGRIVRAGPVFERKNIGYAPETWVAQFDLAVHADGFVVAAPQLLDDFNFVLELRASTMQHRLADLGWVDPKWRATPPIPEFWSTGGDLTSERCGMVTMHIEGVGYTTVAGPYLCSLMRKAPILAREDLRLSELGNFTKGPGPFTAGVCVTGADKDELVICYGADTLGEEDALDRVASLVSSSPADGALSGNVPVELRLDRGPTADEAAVIEVLDTITGERINGALVAGAEPGMWSFQQSGTWREGTRYRFAIWYKKSHNGDDPKRWMFFDREPPVVFIRAGAPAIDPDPRTELIRYRCEDGWARDEHGVCAMSEPLSPRGTIYVPLPFDPTGPPPWLVDDTGAVVPSELVIDNGPLRLAQAAPLRSLTRYEVVFPDATKNLIGGSFHPDDLRLAFTTYAGQPQLVSSIPASGAGGIDPAAALELVFDVPTFIRRPGAVALMQNASVVPLSMLQVDDRTYRFLHDPLEPSTSYRLLLTSGIDGPHGDELLGTPLTITFTTGS